MVPFALKSVDTRINQSFPTPQFRKVAMARYLAHYPAVSSAKKVPARCSDFSKKMTYGAGLITLIVCAVGLFFE